MSDLVIFWHRRDLRLDDNVGLAAARQRSAKVVGLFCLDPQILNAEDIAPVRVTYMIGCLQALQASYQQAGGQLLILQAAPDIAIPQLAQALSAQAVFWNRDVEPYAQTRDAAVETALQAQGIAVSKFWDQLLHAPEAIRTGTGQVYTVFSPFCRNWLGQEKAAPLPPPTGLISLTPAEQAKAEKVGAIPLPTAAALGFSWSAPLVLAPGEESAQAQLAQFCQKSIADYQDARNFPATPGTSLLSAALKFGVLGIRRVWQTTVLATADCRSDESRAGIHTWRQELAWREFYQYVLYAFPELAEGPYRDTFKAFPWQNNPDYFQAWCDGMTGYPLVDAAMRQLNQTGWMHNRCRMIVASFLTKDLLIDPRWGEKYFMQRLIDGDLAANNGGWQWSASSGMDPKPLRIFNPATQAQKFDPEADYIRHWLPELNKLDTRDLLMNKLSETDVQRCGYTLPIVDHNLQQKRFKELYKDQKAASTQLSLGLEG
jgi:deoxyribodipyrimidine photo-lyase